LELDLRLELIIFNCGFSVKGPADFAETKEEIIIIKHFSNLKNNDFFHIIAQRKISMVPVEIWHISLKIEETHYLHLL